MRPMRSGMVPRLLILLAFLACAAPASAAVTASHVDAPANGTQLDFDRADPGMVTITGTATADDPSTDRIDVACTNAEQQDGTASVAARPPTGLGQPLTPTGPHSGTFSVAVSRD